MRIRRRRRRNPETRAARSRAARAGWRHRRRNPETRTARARAARAGWRHRRHRNPESGAERSRAARAGWRHRRHRNPESRGERSRAARAGWRHRRHNPFGRGMTSDVMGDIMPAAIGGAGAVALDIALAYVPLPATFQTGYGNYLAKIAGSFGLGWLAGMALGKRKGTLVTVGALTVSLYTIIRSIAQTSIGTTVKGLSGLADFRDYSVGRMGAYMAPRPGMGAYLRPRMGAYMNPAAVITAPAVTPSAGALAAKRASALSGVRLGARRVGPHGMM